MNNKEESKVIEQQKQRIINLIRERDRHAAQLTPETLNQFKTEVVGESEKQIGALDPEYYDQEYVEIPRREVINYTDKLRKGLA